jgi:predicted site-specific integrase-resolvase
MKNKYYRPEQIAKMFKVDIRTVYRWRKSGLMGGWIKINNTLVLPEHEIERFLANTNN